MQGNVIGLVSYSCHQKKIVIERTRDLIYLKFVATDFYPKIISPSAGEKSGDLAYSAVSALLMNPLLTRRSVEHCTPHADGAWLNELGWSQ